MAALPDVTRPAGPGARHLPVIVLSEPDLLDAVEAGARRAGGDPGVARVLDPHPDTLRSALGAGHEIVVVLCPSSAEISVIRLILELGGRPIPVMAMTDTDSAPTVSRTTLSLLTDPGLREIEVPVPSVGEDRLRRWLWDQLRAERVEERHHLVEVDGGPALEELDEQGGLPSADRWALLAAGAAGVLAGRLAVANRRWAQL